MLIIILFLGCAGRSMETNDMKTTDNKEIVIRVDPNFYRPTEVESLIGDASKAHEKLGWKPKVKIEDLVKEMIEKDNKHAKRLVTSNLRPKRLN